MTFLEVFHDEQPPAPMSAVNDPESRLTILETTIWGRNGDNGMRSDLKAVTAAVAEFPDLVRTEVKTITDRMDERDEKERDQKRSQVRWLIGLVVAFAGVLVGAVTAILEASGHA